MAPGGGGVPLCVYITSIGDPPQGRKREAETRAGRALLAHALNRARPGSTLLAAGDIEPLLSFGPQGKPFFREPGWEFSISHSHGLVACGFSAGPLGLDLERVRTFPPRLAERIQAPGEAPLVEHCPDPDCLWTQLWTCKESYMKYTGLGMAQGTAAMPFARLGPAPRLAAGEGPLFRSFRLLRGGEPFWLTVCREEPGPLAVELVAEGQIAALLA